MNAGAAQTITLPATASLAGTASDDGLPNPPGALTTTWSKLTGPGTVTFGNANALTTTATFSTAGSYVLRLTASDGALASTSDVTITVNPVSTPANTPPVLGAQANEIVAIGTTFTRTLTATDPDAGDVLTYALVTGPSGMVLSGATLSWATTGKAPGDYAVTVRVTDGAGAFDQKSFTITLQAAQNPIAPLAVNDSYTVKPGATLAVAAPGVLANDTSESGAALSASKLTDPGKGTLSAFNADGSFTYVAPGSLPPETSMLPKALWGALVPDDTGFAFAADINHDGAADVIVESFGTPIAFDGKTGAKLWHGWDTSPTSLGKDCKMYLFATDYAMGDVDGSGDITLIAGSNCDGSTLGASSGRLIAVDTNPAHAVGGAARVKWVSARLDEKVPMSPSVGAAPVPTYINSW